MNIRERDGLFLETILDRAAQAGVQDELRVKIDVQTQTSRNLKAMQRCWRDQGASDEAIVLSITAFLASAGFAATKLPRALMPGV